jgi:hypothetical protein
MNPLEFIQSVKDFDKHGDITKLFTKKYCYGFALMMKQEFKEGTIYWDKWLGHAIIKVGDKYYDINGEYFPMNYSMLNEVPIQIIEGVRI